MKGSIPALIQESLQDSEGGRERCPHSALSPSGLRNCSLGSNQGFPVKGEPGGAGVTCHPASAQPSAIPGTARGPGHFGSESGGPLPVEGCP